MAARRALITRYDRVKTGTITGGSWLAASPLTNLQDMNPQKIAESTDALAASTTFDVDFGASYSIGLLALLNNDVNSGASLRVRLSTVSDFASNVYDSGTVGAWPSDANGTYSSDEYAALGRPRFFIPTAPVTCRYARVEFTGVSGQVKLGVFCACQVIEPSRNLLQYSAPFTVEDASDVRRVPFGSTYITSVPTRIRALDIGSKYLPTSEALTSVFPLVVSAGQSVPLIVAPSPDDTNNLSRTVIYGLLEINHFSNSFFGLYEWVSRIKQLT